MWLSRSCYSVSQTAAVLQRAARRDPFHRLARDLGDPVEVLVVVPDDRALELGHGGDEQVGHLHAAVVEGVTMGQAALHLERACPGVVSASKLTQGSQATRRDIVVACAPSAEEHLQLHR